MSNFNFFHPIDVRYSELDPQWHVNNVRIVEYTEQGRLAYLRQLDLWDGVSFLDLGLIVADVHVSYIAPITLGQAIRIGVRVARIGTKSLQFEYLIEDTATGQPLAKAETVMVAYDYHTHSTTPVSQDWRQKISTFEGVQF